MLLEQFRELGDSLGAILLAHAFRTGTDTDLNHTRLDGIGDVDACLQTAGTLPVDRLCGCGYGKAGGEGGGAELGGSTAGSEDGADGDVFDEFGVDAGALDEGFEGADEEVRRGCVFEAAFAAFCDGGSESTCYDNLERVRRSPKLRRTSVNLHRRDSSPEETAFPLRSSVRHQGGC
jgi:hypothetical protein